MSKPNPTGTDDIIDKLLAFSATLANEEAELVENAAKTIRELQAELSKQQLINIDYQRRDIHLEHDLNQVKAELQRAEKLLVLSDQSIENVLLLFGERDLGADTFALIEDTNAQLKDYFDRKAK